MSCYVTDHGYKGQLEEILIIGIVAAQLSENRLMGEPYTVASII